VASKPDQALSRLVFGTVIALLQILGLITLFRPKLLFPNGFIIRPELLWGFGVAIVLAVLGSRFGRHLISDTAIALVLFASYMAREVVSGIGDTSWEALSSDESKQLWASSYLSHLLLRLLFKYFDGPTYLSPISGLLTMICCLAILRKLSRSVSPTTYLATRLLLLSAGAHLVFFRGLVETPPPALPVLTAGIWSVLNYTEDPRRSVAPPSALLTLAVLFHGQNLIYLSAFVASVGIAGSLDKNGKWRVIRDLAKAVVASALVLALVIAITAANGYEIVKGDSAGGGDSRILSNQIFDLDHLFQVAMIQFLAFGVVIVVVPLAIIGFRWRGEVHPFPIHPVLSLLVLASLTFTMLWGFDLGFPRDYDLMIGHMLVQLPLLAIVSTAAAAHAPKATIAILLVAVAVNLVNVSGFLRG
jgi:hypothetical protein